MKDFLNPKIRAEEKHIHEEIRMNVTETDELRNKWKENTPKVELTDEQLQTLYAKEEENKRRNHNEFRESKYWTREYLEDQYADKTLRESE